MRAIRAKGYDMGERVLVLASADRDLALLRPVLAKRGVQTEMCQSIAALCQAIEEGAGTALVAHEALAGDAISRLARTLARQPRWSDFPLVILTGNPSTDQPRRVFATLHAIGNATLLERPVREETLISAVQVALRARRRQYEIREHLRERAETEQSLRLSEERLRFALGAARMAAWEWDLTSDDFVRSSSSAMFLGPGFRRKTLSEFVEWVHPEDRQLVQRALQRAIVGHSEYNAEYRLLRSSDDSVTWIADQGRVSLDANGRPAIIRGVARDITERRKADEELAQWQRRYEAAVRASGQILYDWDPRTNRIVWAGNVAGILGYEPEELGDLGHWIEQIHPDDRLAFQQQITALVDSGRQVQLEYRARRKDGAFIDLEHRGDFFLDSAGDISRMIGFIFDISHRKDAERALRESEDRLRLAVEATGLGTWDYGLSTGTLNWSDRCKSIFGLPPETEMSYALFLDQIRPEDRARVDAAVRQALDPLGDGDYDIEHRTVRQEDDQPQWVAMKGKTLFTMIDGQIQPVRMIGTVIDITERKRAEEHQKMLMVELNHRVKNTLAVVLSIASQTMRNSASIEAFTESFTGRLRSLADAHALLAQANWRTADLAELVEHALRPYAAAGRDNVRVSGDDIALPPPAALTMSMILHELTTNAAKYGAFSVQSGIVEVSWHLDQTEEGQRLFFRWRESEGPRIEEPTRRGFGMEMIEFSVKHEFGGALDLAYPPEGLRCELVLPWNASATVLPVRAPAP